MPARELKIFGDYLYFDEQSIASIAHLPAAVRARLTDYIEDANEAVENAEGTRKIDVRKLTEDAKKVVLDQGTGNIIGTYFEGPPLPDDHEIVTVVSFEMVKDLLTDDEGFELEGDDE